MSVWKMLITSVTSPRQIAELLDTKKRSVLGYLALLILLCLIPTFIMTSLTIDKGVQDFQSFMKSEDVPDFQLQDGVLTSDLQEPIVTELERQTFVFDTTGTYNEDKVRKEKASFAVLRDRFITNDGVQEQQFLYSELSGLTFSKTELNQLVDAIAGLKWLAIFGAIIFVYIFQYVKLLLIAVVLALIGLLIYASSGQKLSFGRLWVVAAFSATIPTVVSWTIYSVGVRVPFSGIIYMIASGVILYIVLREISRRVAATTADSE